MSQINLPLTKKQFRILRQLDTALVSLILDAALEGIKDIFEDCNAVPGHGIMSMAIPHTVDKAAKRDFDKLKGLYLGASLPVASSLSIEDSLRRRINGGYVT